MFVLERIYPLKAVKNKILLYRLPINYCKRPLIEADFHREDAGYWGEKALDYYLSFLPEDQYYIFQDLRLKFDKWTFQIDFLLLTTKFALIIEAKNYAGNLHFENKFNQLIQTHNEKEKGYDNPISQVERQQRLLKKWFEKYLTVVFPIDFFVVMSNSNAILSTDSAEIPKKVCKPFHLLTKIEELERSYQKEKTDLKTLKKICKLLLKHHTPKSFHCLEEYKIPGEDIITGVRCPICNSIPMTYQYGKWYCHNCKVTLKDALIASLTDYFLLIRPSITNSKFKKFLHLPSSNVASKLLVQLDLPYTGCTRNRVYYQKEVK